MSSKKVLKTITGYPIFQEINKIAQKNNIPADTFIDVGRELRKNLTFQQMMTDLFNSIINPYLDLSVTSRHVLSKIVGILQVESGTIHIIGKENKILTLKSSQGVSKEYLNEVKEIQIGKGALGLVAEKITHPVVVPFTQNQKGSKPVTTVLETIQREVNVLKNPIQSPNEVLFLPIRFKDDLVGVLSLFTREGKYFSTDTLEILNVLSSYLALGFKNNILFEITRRQATRDSLTDLHNRMYFQEFLNLELNRSKRYKKPLSVAMMDIDYFKNINDNYGHSVGDIILKEFAGILKKSFRKTDLVARYGGEEFIVVFPEADTENTLRVVTKLQKRLNNHIFESKGNKHQITISMGISVFIPDKIITQNELITRADKALYFSKENGRDQISVWDKVSDTQPFSKN